MNQQVILRSSNNPVHLSYLAAVLSGEGLDPEVHNVKTGAWRLLIGVDQMEVARTVLRSHEIDRARGATS